ncbi:fumarylacetoacetate hydrolase family protein [Paenibacillus harenae]|uniref:2-keto-4-pentenoate hydratase/2-oxohepta-3-ene-1,7-dioic acid hydratase in catechol pathway n=1 Tax=Paenibacillus harenae TaxID=306543 RepID=A0ABT9U5D2_PAEHA|nr:fumarylacetoacetate hydrolase family protein [Paenibacillus harenae]MDQ0113469.1 2-keto-4-pentenoate hydratase/2-oxohepta-3-ene-1,7-dioic acid hydratase in catechol pathway [Paenibacillus harenae]
MRISTVKLEEYELAALNGDAGLVLMDTINKAEGKTWHTELFDIIRLGELDDITEWYESGGKKKLADFPALPYGEAEYGPLYRNPRKIWGIGMNYVKSEDELAAADPADEPVSFMKPDTTLIGPLDAIRIPAGVGTITAEAELGIVIGKACKNITEVDYGDVIAGYVATIDVTASDIHARNQRFLTRAKSFDTFFSLGSTLVTKEELPDLLGVHVETALNGEVVHRNKLFNMKFRPDYAVAFHSKVMTLLPGDIIMTGTPGAVVIRDGDIIECRMDGFEPLHNPVRE